MPKLERMIAAAQARTETTIGDFTSDGRATISVSEAGTLAAALANDAMGTPNARYAEWQRLLDTAAFANADARALVDHALPHATRVIPRDVADPDSDGSEFAIEITLDNGTRLNIGTAAWEHGGAPETLRAGEGRFIAYSREGSIGGAELAGDALELYDLRTRRTTTVIDTGRTVNGLSEIIAPNGRRYIVVTLQTNNEGPASTAIVDPLRRAVVFFAEDATVTSTAAGVRASDGTSITWAALRNAEPFGEGV